MRNLMNSDQAYTNLVQKYIGSAFDQVRAVAEQLHLLKKLQEAIEAGDLIKIAEHIEELQALNQKLDQFFNIYYGPLPAEPSKRPDGSKHEEGDIYYDTSKHGLYVFTSGSWQPVASNFNKLEVFKMTAADISNSNTRLQLSSSYQPNNNQLLVFVNATFQYPLTTQTPDGAYIEDSRTSISFPPKTLEVGDVVTVLKGDVVTSVDHVMSVDVENYQTAFSNEKVITLPGGMDYVPGVHNLEVYIGGVRQLLGVDYVETDPQHITFQKNLPIGTLVTMKVGSIIAANYAQGQQGVPTAVLNVASEFQVRQGSLRKDGIVILIGYTTANDGGGGIFVYDAAKNRLEANGGSVIDATTPLDSQGTGAGLGCWARIYSNEVKPQWWGIHMPLVPELVNMGPGQPGDVVTVYGFHEQGDGGEGKFYWDPTQPKRNHDGGTVIDPDKAFVSTWNNTAQMRDWFAPKAAGVGCWVRFNDNIASFTWFGAKTDGTNNSLVLEGIERAINAGQISALYIPAGTFSFSSNEYMQIRLLPGQFHLYGEGEESVLQFDIGSNAETLTFIDDSDIIIENLMFKSTRPVGDNICFSMQNCSNVKIKNCYFDGFSGEVIKLTENTTTNVSTACSNFYFEDNVIRNCSTDLKDCIMFAPKTLSEDIVFKNNLITNSGSADYSIFNFVSACRETVVRNNVFAHIAGSCISVAAYEDIEIVENTIEDFGRYAIKLDVSSTANYLDPAFGFAKINQNIITRPGTNSNYGIYIEGNVNNTATESGPIDIEDNNVMDCGGILLSPQVKLQEVNIYNNKLQRIPDNFYGVFADDVNGGYLGTPIIRDNLIENKFGASQNALINLKRTDEPMIEGNILEKSGQFDISLTDCKYSEIRNNLFINSNVSNLPGHACVSITDNTSTEYLIKNNQIVKGSAGKPRSLVATTSPIPEVYCANNSFGRANIPVTLTNANLVEKPVDAVIQMGSVKHFYARAVPAGGTYGLGDIVWNVRPSAGGTVGWVCTTAGTPGTWKPFGNIAT